MKTKRKVVVLYTVGYSFELGHHVYQMKCYENAVESELRSNSVFKTEEEAELYAKTQNEKMGDK